MNNKPLAGFPPSLRLKEHQTKHTSFIPTERLQEISRQDFWRSHAPRGASYGFWEIFFFRGAAFRGKLGFIVRVIRHISRAR